MKARPQPAEPPKSVLVTERMQLVQLAPCCLDHMFGVDGAYDRRRLAHHIEAKHEWTELPW